ncbi:MAG: PEP-CTERM sorting domain-containing protein [Planctomycetota bacterium]
MKPLAKFRTPFSRSLACAGLCLTVLPAHAGELSFEVVADGSSRWFDFFSDSFAQLDQGFNGNQSLDGFFLISSQPGFVPEGSGADVFPSEANFNRLGTFTFDGPDGGTGTFNITAFDLDFARHVADDDSLYDGSPLSLGPYQTIVTNISGTVTLVDGTIQSFNSVEADVAFRYNFIDPTIPAPTFADYDEEDALTIDGLDFSLDVFDAEQPSSFSPSIAQQWLITGSVVPVPEPAALTLLAVGVAAATLRRRRNDEEEDALD